MVRRDAGGKKGKHFLQKGSRSQWVNQVTQFSKLMGPFVINVKNLSKPSPKMPEILKNLIFGFLLHYKLHYKLL